MKKIAYIILILLPTILSAQLFDEEEITKHKSTGPAPVDFSNMFQSDESTYDDLENWKQQRDRKIQQRMSQIDVLEKEVDPEKYIVGPGDLFLFNIWGALEMQIPVKVNPEGKLLISSVGEIPVSGLTLAETQAKVIREAKPFYEKSEISLSLESPRFFRVHVVGEVKFPGTYIGQAGYRISEMITESGGITNNAWKTNIQLHRSKGTKHTFDLLAFEQLGNLNADLFVNGGDVIYIPSVNESPFTVTVEGDLNNAGIYPVIKNELLLKFILQNRLITQYNTLKDILVLRSRPKTLKKYKNHPWETIHPFPMGQDTAFTLQSGDRILIPSSFVYVKGTVNQPGAYPYSTNLSARDYAVMAGASQNSGSINGVRVYHVRTGKTEKGTDIIVEPGDIVIMHSNWIIRFRNVMSVVTTLASLVLAAKAADIL